MQFSYKWYLKNSVFAQNKGTVFSFFAGGGGSSLGYKLAGFKVLGCNEVDEKVARLYKANLKPRLLYLEPIQAFKERESFPKQLYNLDIMDGSPPCSSFTNAGKRGKDWGKMKKFREGQTEQVLDTLFFDFIDVAKILQPKVIIAENVPGIMFGEAIQYVQKIYREFDKAGYFVNHWLLDSSVMGVPQKRERVFFIAMRKDLAKLFPYKTGLFNQLPQLNLNFNERKIKLKEILGQPNDTYVSLTPYMEEQWEKTKIGGYVTKFQSGNSKLSMNQVCPVISSSGKYAHFHPTEKRTLGKKEILLVHSFPLDYNFLDSKNYQYIPAMSVPPVMIAQIATRIYEQWLSKLTDNENTGRLVKKVPHIVRKRFAKNY